MSRTLIVVTGPSGAGKTAASRLLAASFDRGVHLRTDDFLAAIVAGAADPASPDADHQNHVVGGAFVAASFAFATGGYTVVLDGHVFADALAQLAPACAARGVALHHALLLADLDTCVERVGRRDGEIADLAALARLHDRARHGVPAERIVDASPDPFEVARAVRAAFGEGRLRLA